MLQNVFVRIWPPLGAPTPATFNAKLLLHRNNYNTVFLGVIV